MKTKILKILKIALLPVVVFLIPMVVFLMTLSSVCEWADRAYWRMFSWINKGES